MLNQLLQKQIEQHLGKHPESLPQGFDTFLAAVSDTYDRHLRSFISSDCALTVSARSERGDVAMASSGSSHEELLHISLLLETEMQRRQLAELQCYSREAHLKASQRIANIGSWEVNFRDGKMVEEDHYWSDETYRIMGYAMGQAPTAEMFFDRVHPDDRELVRYALQYALGKRVPYFVEHRLLMPDDSEKLVCERAQIIFCEDGQPGKLIGTIQDITHTKVYETKLETASRELRMLFENMQEVFFSVDMVHDRLIQISPACEHMYGYTPAEFESNLNLWIDVIFDEDKQAVYDNDVIMREGRSISQEYRIRHKDGSVKWLESRIEPTLNKDGKLIRIDGVTSDITLRKEVEIVLRNSEHKFRSLIQNSSDAITVINKDMEITFASDSVARITGMDSAKVLGAQSQFFTHPQDLEKLENFMRELLENPGERRRITYRILRNDGSFVWCDRVSVNLLQDPAVQGIVSNFRDITEQIIYEEALRASNEELRKSNMELDKFVYSVSHDLRAPLSSMMGILNILELETEDGTVLEYTGMLRNSIRKLDGFISDILDYSRNARMAIEPQEIDINGLVDDITGNLKFMDTAYAVNVQVQVTGDFPMRSDRSRIAIILNNLISNAIRYHDPARGIPDVAVRLSTTAETCTIEVKDNGIGIEQKEQEKVFDMFYRVSNKSIGSGLGLYIVKETVEKLGGVIGLSSEPGVGTVVQITVPNLI